MSSRIYELHKKIYRLQNIVNIARSDNQFMFSCRAQDSWRGRRSSSGGTPSNLTREDSSNGGSTSSGSTTSTASSSHQEVSADISPSSSSSGTPSNLTCEGGSASVSSSQESSGSSRETPLTHTTATSGHHGNIVIGSTSVTSPSSGQTASTVTTSCDANTIMDSARATPSSNSISSSALPAVKSISRVGANKYSKETQPLMTSAGAEEEENEEMKL